MLRDSATVLSVEDAVANDGIVAGLLRASGSALRFQGKSSGFRNENLVIRVSSFKFRNKC